MPVSKHALKVLGMASLLLTSCGGKPAPLFGADQNGNKVWDDVESGITDVVSEPKRPAAFNQAIGLQEMIAAGLLSTRKGQTEKATERAQRAINHLETAKICAVRAYEKELADKLAEVVKSNVASTEQREKYMNIGLGLAYSQIESVSDEICTKMVGELPPPAEDSEQ